MNFGLYINIPFYIILSYFDKSSGILKLLKVLLALAIVNGWLNDLG